MRTNKQTANTSKTEGRDAAIQIKFMKHYVTDGQIKARVWYSLDNRIDGRRVVTLYAKDYGGALGKIFDSGEYENNTDTLTDYFEKGTVRLFENHPLYAAARERAEAMLGARK